MAEAAGNHSTMGNIREYMGDIMLSSGDGAKATEYYENTLRHRQMAEINDAAKAQAQRAYTFKTSIAAMVSGEIETAASRVAEYNAAAEAHGTAFEQRRIHELNAYLAQMNEDSETAAAEFAQASQLEPTALYWAAVNNRILGHTEKAADLANRAAYRNTLSPNLPFFRDEAIALLEELEAE